MTKTATTSQDSFASQRAENYKRRINPPVEEVKPARATRTPREKRETEVAGPVIVIISALYGIEGTRVEFWENVKVGKKLTNRMVGSDPAPKVAKDAIITATIDGDKALITVKEGEVISFSEYIE